MATPFARKTAKKLNWKIVLPILFSSFLVLILLIAAFGQKSKSSADQVSKPISINKSLITSSVVKSEIKSSPQSSDNKKQISDQNALIDSRANEIISQKNAESAKNFEKATNDANEKARIEQEANSQANQKMDQEKQRQISENNYQTEQNRIKAQQASDANHAKALEQPQVLLPAPQTAPPVQEQNSNGATALCFDDSLSYSKSRSGTCSHHGGVKIWY